MSARILKLPRTDAGRAELRAALNPKSSADFRAYLVETFDWDEEAVEMVRMGISEYPAAALLVREAM
ncbi:hypothetical protein [Magnetospirillum molischianum]|uniref:Uncharacterized protein n=1 Tax=Magnetospirillum molischianum DSM 120 TaxID=1150626 RepID=H8FT93_MAGML|nr:hypothetical protein [Magnetospirillum molischianum]CCG41581.1 hypothetical protein PHAMO_280115 [Magnetospirillum molischianum DSM 120]